MNRKIGQTAFVAVLLASWLTTPGLAQGTDQDLRDELDALRQGQQEIQKQLAELTKLVKARPAAPAQRAAVNVKGKAFDLANNVVLGESTAKLTLVEFTDYQ